jgi:hypothetical protein
MKKIPITLIAFTLATSALAGQRFEAAVWRDVQTYDVLPLLKQEASLIGKIVAVRFHYRSAKLHHLRPKWYEASIWQHDAKAKGGFSAQRVVVAKIDSRAFESITSDSKSMADVTVYGRIEKDPDNNETQMRLIGRKVTLDAAGNATVD